MSLKIEQGLFALDFTDHYAILGVPVNADPKDVRKQYLKIARRLHPDSGFRESEEDRQKAAEYLSKLVNPAYEKLSQEKNYAEYSVLLRLKGQQVQRQQETVLLISDPARKLVAATDVEVSYRAALKQLAEHQYEHLNQTLDIIGQISELNLVYLMRTGGRVNPIRPVESKGDADNKIRVGEQPPIVPPRPREKPPITKSQVVAAYLRRAQEFEARQDYNKAILELRGAIEVDPRSSAIHSRLGVVYLKTNQPTMAKIHFNKALELNPQDPVALEGKRRVDPAGTAPKATTKGNITGSKSSKPEQSGGGLFGLSGGKKK
jgi:curved DNA-binding protein CbpA